MMIPHQRSQQINLKMLSEQLKLTINVTRYSYKLLFWGYLPFMYLYQHIGHWDANGAPVKAEL